MIVRGDERGMAVYSDKESGSVIVQNALKDTKPPIAKGVVAFIHWLGSQGCLQFRDFLK
jgi:hypothetical protein